MRPGAKVYVMSKAPKGRSLKNSCPLAGVQPIDKALGITSENHPAIGAWADGAENSMMVVSPGASTAQIRAASAMKGYIADQKAVLVFHPSHTGRNFLASFDVEGKAVDLHEQLLKEGLSFHTLQPVGEGAFASMSSLRTMRPSTRSTKASVGVRCHPGVCHEATANSSAPRRKMGQIESNAMTQENNTNKSSETIADSGALEGQDIGKTWDEIRDHWSESEASAEHQSTPDPDIPPTRD